MSAWAETTLIVEASQRSAALITARYAKEHHRQLYAVPNGIYARESQGANALVAEGAKIYLEPIQLIDAHVKVQRLSESADKCNHGLTDSKLAPPLQAANSSLEAAILARLGHSKVRLETLTESFPANRNDFLETISTMHIDGKIVLLPGGFVRRP